jgi:serine/threonine protein kinase
VIPENETPENPVPETTPDRGEPESSGGGSRDAPSPVRQIGPYRIVEEIGRGGMGVVFKALQPALKRTVALKVLIAGEDASEEAIARFHREAEAVAKLGHHPNIVPVYDIGTEGNRHYFAMHYVEGQPLDRVIDEGELSPDLAAGIAEKIAEALHHAHQHGVLHRDVKPSNVILASLEGESGREGEGGRGDEGGGEKGGMYHPPAPSPLLPLERPRQPCSPCSRTSAWPVTWTPSPA